MAPSKAEPLYCELGRRIQGLRLRRKMTQEQLGQLLDPPVGRASIANLEGGKQRILLHTFLQIAQILECDFSDLVPAEPTSLQNQVVENEVTSELEKLKVSGRALERIRRQLVSKTPKEVK
jgi:transcriptional regulator with XRE-family HTH domain